MKLALTLLAITACGRIPFLDSALPSTGNLFEHGGLFEPLSTNLKDARPTEAWLEIVDPSTRGRPQRISSRLLPADVGAGYHTALVKSYCLHPGKHAATFGTGYGLAPYNGLRAGVLDRVVKRSAQHPEIPQSDVQLLLWAIELGHQLGELDPSKLPVYRALLDDRDVALLSINAKDIAGSASARFGDGFAAFDRGLVDPNMSYPELERIAVPLVAPDASLGASHWTFVGHGLFARAKAHGYQKTEVELYRPHLASFERDAHGQIVAITSGGTRAVMRTDPVRGHGVAFSYLPDHDEMFIPDSVLASPRASRRHAASHCDPTLFAEPDSLLEKIPEYYEKWEKLEDLETAFDTLNHAIDYSKQSTDPQSLDERGQEALKEMQTAEYMADLLHAASDPSGFYDKAKVLQQHFFNITDVAMYVMCKLRGECSADDPAHDDADALSELVAVPYNTNAQRLALSTVITEH